MASPFLPYVSRERSIRLSYKLYLSCSHIVSLGYPLTTTPSAPPRATPHLSRNPQRRRKPPGKNASIVETIHHRRFASIAISTPFTQTVILLTSRHVCHEYVRASSNMRASASRLALHGAILVRRCCGSVPSTSASTSDALKPTCERPSGNCTVSIRRTSPSASSRPACSPSSLRARLTSTPKSAAHSRWRSGQAGPV